MVSKYSFFVKELFFVASNEHAAEVIGQNGWKVKTIAMQTGTQIKCPSPGETPIFSIAGNKHDVNVAKKMIQNWANHFDLMKSKKRTIKLEPGDLIETAMFTSLDVPCIIGKKGKQVKKIARLADVNIISPDVNKEPVFILSGKQEKVKLAIFWMKLTTFCSTSTSYFNRCEVLIIHQILNGQRSSEAKATERIIKIGKFREIFKVFNGCYNFFGEKIVRKKMCLLPRSYDSYNCCYCRKRKFRVAKAFCGDVISCDTCIVDLFQNIHLRCYFCKAKIENFLIENYNF
jgi:polyribonucleotide nucleotidyltransferase